METCSSSFVSTDEFWRSVMLPEPISPVTENLTASFATAIVTGDWQAALLMALEAALAQPSGLALAGRHLFIADSEVSSIRVFDLSTRKVSTLAGQGLFDFGDVDGEGEAVRLQHPLGLTMGGTVFTSGVMWFNVFLAWLIKGIVLKYGGSKLYRQLRPFFIGMILGAFVVSGTWLVIDYFTGMQGNSVLGWA